MFAIQVRAQVEKQCKQSESNDVDRCEPFYIDLNYKVPAQSTVEYFPTQKDFCKAHHFLMFICARDD